METHFPKVKAKVTPNLRGTSSGFRSHLEKVKPMGFERDSGKN
jgi:hypothetical protein